MSITFDIRTDSQMIVFSIFSFQEIGFLLSQLCQLRNNFELSCFWKAGFNWKLGDYANGYLAFGSAPNFEDAITQLADAALKHFPNCEFAKNFQRVSTSL
ncbi:MAG: hypothetical protein DMG93_12210 [Acidobacteria bacterium]|nr:MAG: hypothetical protein DMG93_12210 [Acidobacteriota bacterium]